MVVEKKEEELSIDQRIAEIEKFLEEQEKKVKKKGESKGGDLK